MSDAERVSSERASRGGLVLVTGGCGFLGEEVIRAYLDRGFRVRSFDKVAPEYTLEGVDYVRGDIRDPAQVADAATGAQIVVHAVAAVPLSKSPTEFREVNVDGTGVALQAARDAGVRKFVYVSSSAVYGIPDHNPVVEDDPRQPLEAYGRAKNDAETICQEFAAAGDGFEVSIVRPRTILGPGRLGIFGILFDWVSSGASVPVIGRGDNVYQFVHVTDLADVIVTVSIAEGSDSFNIGGGSPGTMRSALQTLCDHAGTGARVFRLPKGLFAAGAKLTSRLGLSPLAPYHWLLYGESLYFSGEKPERVLGWTPRYSSTEALIASYDSFLARTPHESAGELSPHRSVPKQGLLGLARGASRLLFSRTNARASHG